MTEPFFFFFSLFHYLHLFFLLLLLHNCISDLSVSIPLLYIRRRIFLQAYSTTRLIDLKKVYILFIYLNPSPYLYSFKQHGFDGKKMKKGPPSVSVPGSRSTMRLTAGRRVLRGRPFLDSRSDLGPERRH